MLPGMLVISRIKWYTFHSACLLATSQVIHFTPSSPIHIKKLAHTTATTDTSDTTATTLTIVTSVTSHHRTSQKLLDIFQVHPTKSLHMTLRHPLYY